MPKIKPNNFLETISYLRQEEHLVIHDNVLKTTQKEDEDIILFLEIEYENESLNFPFKPPKFNSKAGLWASKITYYAALLLLHRGNTKKDLSVLFPNFDDTINESAILSADLCLRFLPQINFELQRIDANDPLVPILNNILANWHYSAVNNESKPPEKALPKAYENKCVLQLFLDRIVEKKAIHWAETPFINTILNKHLGYYKDVFWRTLKTNELEINE